MLNANVFPVCVDTGKIFPDPSVREAAMLDLGVRSPSVSAPWDTPAPPPAVTGEAGLPADTSSRFVAESKIATASSPTRAEPVRRKLSRTWSELPIIGKAHRRRDETAVGNVRGTVLVAMDRAITTRYGGDVRDEILGALPRETRDIFRGGMPSAGEWYSTLQVAGYLKGCNEVAVHDDAGRWRALGYAGVETDLLTLLRSARNQADGYVALREALPNITGLFDFGRWTLQGDAQLARLVASGLARTPPSLHDWLAGVIELAARATGRPYRVSIHRETNDVDEDSAIQFTATLVGYTD